MPCYEVNLISVDLKVADHDMLLDAIKALGLKYRVIGDSIEVDTPAGQLTISNGTAQFSNSSVQQWVNKIKQAYSFKTVEKVSKKYKFTLTTKGENKIVLRRY